MTCGEKSRNGTFGDQNCHLIYRMGTTQAVLEYIVPTRLFLLTSLWNDLQIPKESHLLGPPLLLPFTYRSCAHTSFNSKEKLTGAHVPASFL